MNVVESKFDSDVFGLRVGRLEIPDGCGRPEGLKVPFDVVFVKVEGWVYPTFNATAIDHRYEMEKTDRPSTGAEVSNVACKPEQLERLAGEAFANSRFLRDKRLAAKAPRLYASWLKAPGSCWALPGLERDAFLLQTWDDPYVARISLIAVRPEAQGLGLGRKLLSGVLGRVSSRSWRVCVSACNLKAIRLYESFGFKVLSASTVYHVWVNRGRGKCKDA